jgi:hypothetical protein
MLLISNVMLIKRNFKMRIYCLNYIVIIVLLTFGCSTNHIDSNISKKMNSKNLTEQDFSNIENGVKTPSKRENITDEKRVPQNAPNEVNNKFTIETKKSGNEDRVIELNQILTFYCMKGSRISRFQSPFECANYVKIVLAKCEKSSPIVDSNLIRCVKASLKVK